MYETLFYNHICIIYHQKMSFIAWARLLRTGKTVVMQFFLFLIPWDISWTRQKLLQSFKCWGHSLTSSFLEMNLSLSLLQSLKKLDWVALVQDVSPKIHGPLVIKGFPVLRLSWQDTWTQKWFFAKRKTIGKRRLQERTQWSLLTLRRVLRKSDVYVQHLYWNRSSSFLISWSYFSFQHLFRK